jgi:hypothetical protein
VRRSRPVVNHAWRPPSFAAGAVVVADRARVEVEMARAWREVRNTASSRKMEPFKNYYLEESFATGFARL